MRYRMTTNGITNKPMPVLEPPPVAHVALVKKNGVYHCLMVNSGQVTDLFSDHQMTLVQGFQFGFSRALNMPKENIVIIHLDNDAAPNVDDVCEAYARWRVAHD